MPTQFMMAILFCTCDGILNLQNMYYSYWSTSRRLKALQQTAQQQQSHIIVAEANELEALLASTSVNAQAKSHISTSLMVLSRSSSAKSTSTSTSTSTTSTTSTTSSSTSRSNSSPVHPHNPSTAVHRLQRLSAGMATWIDVTRHCCTVCPVTGPVTSHTMYMYKWMSA